MLRIFRIIATLAALTTVGPILAGCGTINPFIQKIENVASAITNTKINRKAVYLAASTADGFVVAADIYLQQPTCNGRLTVCHDARATEPIILAVSQVRHARSDMLSFMKAHPGQLGDKGLYDLMVSSGAQLKSILDSYGVKY